MLNKKYLCIKGTLILQVLPIYQLKHDSKNYNNRILKLQFACKFYLNFLSRFFVCISESYAMHLFCIHPHGFLWICCLQWPHLFVKGKSSYIIGASLSEPRDLVAIPYIWLNTKNSLSDNILYEANGVQQIIELCYEYFLNFLSPILWQS